MATYTIAVIAGDGIGKEVVPAGQAVLEQAARRFGFSLKWRDYDWSCERYAKTGRMMPDDAIDQLRATDAIYLGAGRSEERRVGTECFSTCTSRWSQHHSKTNTDNK